MFKDSCSPTNTHSTSPQPFEDKTCISNLQILYNLIEVLVALNVVIVSVFESLFLLVSAAGSADSKSKEDLGGSTTTEVTVVTVEGGRADLPCDIEAKSKDDSVYLVLWYRKNSGTPIYR